MKNLKRTKALYIRIAPELAELMALMRSADFGRLQKCSDADIIHISIANYARTRLCWSEPGVFDKALNLTDQLDL